MTIDISKGITKLKTDIYQLRGERPGSHVYLIKGSRKAVLIDTGMATYYSHLKAYLLELNLKPKDIDLVILTHEHFDHIGATSYFFGNSVVMGHRLTANKIELQDEFVTMLRYCNDSNKLFRADVWLEDGNIIDLGNYKLEVVHTPGHTSGCICLYEAKEKMLFSGDTVFSGGILSSIASSGNISDYVNSLQRLNSLQLRHLYPGHGKISEDPEGDILRGLEAARSIMEDTKAIYDSLSSRVGRQENVERVLERLSTSRSK